MWRKRDGIGIMAFESTTTVPLGRPPVFLDRVPL